MKIFIQRRQFAEMGITEIVESLLNIKGVSTIMILPTVIVVLGEEFDKEVNLEVMIFLSGLSL